MSIVNADFQFYSVPEAAVELDRTEGRIRQLLLSGELRGHKLGGPNGKWAIPVAEIERYKRGRGKNPPDANPDPPTD